MMKTVKKIPELRFPEFEGEWEEVQFGKRIQRVSEKYNPESDPQEFPCIELESISQDSGTVLQTFNSLELKSIKNKFQKGDILFGKLRPYLKKYYRAAFDGVCSSEIWVLKGKNTQNDFIYYLIQTEKFNNEVNLTIGSKMPRAEWSYISEIEFNFPSLPEQQKIASFLSSADQRIQLLTQKKEKLEQYKKGIMQQIFSQQFRFKDENGKDYPEWEEKRLGDVGKFEGGGTPKSTEAKYWQGSIPWISSSDLSENDISSINISRYITQEAINESATKLIPEKSILIVSRVGIGKFAVAPRDLCTSQDFTNIILFPKSIIPQFLAYYFVSNKESFLALAQGTSIKGFTGDDLKSLKVFIPIQAEQQRIASFLSNLDQKISLVNQQIELTRKWKQGLLQKMFV